MSYPNCLRYAQIVLLGAVFASGCAPAVTLRSQFSAPESQYVLATGSNMIAGQARLILPNGHVRTCEDDGVVLVPATAYSSERMMLAFGGVDSGYARRFDFNRLPNNDLFEKYTRHADCDNKGHFEFDRVADGKYFVVSEITWLMRWARNGGALLASAEVSGGERKTLEMEKTLLR